MSAPAGRRLDAYVHLLDRQVLDVNGRMVAKVDDVELQRRPDGRFAVTGLLVGPGVLGPRLGGVLGRCVSAIWSRLSHADRSGPGRIDMAVVAEIGSAVTLNVSRTDLDVAGFETWTRVQVIEKIPGAFHEPEQ